MFTRLSLSCMWHTYKLPYLHVLWPGALIRNKVQLSAVLQLIFDFAYMCQRVVTPGRYRTSFILVFINGVP